tara:strand:- start:4104 stop:4400 length:297 start_codon:yes stop_codon:yes gene_type:complete
MKWEGEEHLDNYQDLLCYICGTGNAGQVPPIIPMTICKNAQDPSRNDAFGRDGYSACCPKSSCQSKIGFHSYYKEIVLFEKKYELLNWINENPFEVKQ